MHIKHHSIKRWASLFVSLLFFICPLFAQHAHILAYGLDVQQEDETYTFHFHTNMTATEGAILFYDSAGIVIGQIALDNIQAGENTYAVALENLPSNNRQPMTWAVELKAEPITDFTIIHTGEQLNRLHAAIDNSPESDYFGCIYLANHVAKNNGSLYVLAPDYTILNKDIDAGQDWEILGRPAVDAEGSVWLADYGDTHSGVYVMQPSSLSAQPFFTGKTGSTGIWKNNGVEVGSSCSGCSVYGTGSNTKLFAMNEDAGTKLKKNSVNMYEIGTEIGNLHTWETNPSLVLNPMYDNTKGNFSLVGTSRGVWMCQHTDADATDKRSLMFLDNIGGRRFVSTNTDNIVSSIGGGIAVSADERQLLMIGDTKTLLLFDITWEGSTPTLTLAQTYKTEYAAFGTLHFDYAGNVIATAGSTYGTSGNDLRLVVISLPTDTNEVIVPAKKALTVVNTKGELTGISSIEQNSKQVRKVMQDGQIYFIRDGIMYNTLGIRIKN